MNDRQIKFFIERCYRRVFGQQPVVNIGKNCGAAELGPFCINGWISLTAIRERGWLVTTEISERMAWRDLPCVHALDGLVVVRTNLWQALQVAFAHETHLLTHAAIDKELNHGGPAGFPQHAGLTCQAADGSEASG